MTYRTWGVAVAGALVASLLAPTSPVTATPVTSSPSASQSTATAAEAIGAGALSRSAQSRSAQGKAAQSKAALQKSARGKKRYGYRLRLGKGATDRWLGAYRVGSHLVYRIDPARSDAASNRSSYRSARSTLNLNSAKKPSAAATQKAAYILARYGELRDDLQAAAVDAAMLHYLKGGSWRITGKQGRKRINASGHGAAIKGLAVFMIDEAAVAYGPVDVESTVVQENWGPSATITAKLTNRRTGAPVDRVRIRVDVKGVARPEVVTDLNGQGTVAVTAPQGMHAVEVTAPRLPSWRLHVRKPKAGKGSAVAVSGQHSVGSGTTTLQVKGWQSIKVQRPSGFGLVGTPLGGSWGVSGLMGEQEMWVEVHGPFDRDAHCWGDPATRFTSTFDGGEDTQAVPRFLPTKSGYYRWNVIGFGNGATHMGGTCGDNIVVQSQVKVSVATAMTNPQHSTDPVLPGQLLAADVNIEGIDREGISNSLEVQLYGPYPSRATAVCDFNNKVLGGTFTDTVHGNGRRRMTQFRLDSPMRSGWYAWKASFQGSELTRSTESACSGHLRYQA